MNGRIRSESGRRRRSDGFASQPVPSTSRATSRQFNSQPNERPPPEETQELDDVEIVDTANAAVVSALHLAGSGKPFKKADLLQGCRAKGRAVTRAIITMTTKKLQSVYGMTLSEISPGKFILCVPKNTPFRDDLATPVTGVSRRASALLGVVLSLIQFQKGRVAEDDLRNSMLPKLFPDITDNPHPYFGNVDKLMLDFEQMAYLTKETESRGGEAIPFFKWGPRSSIEFDKKALVVPVLAAVFGGNVPKSVMEELDKENTRVESDSSAEE